MKTTLNKAEADELFRQHCCLIGTEGKELVPRIVAEDLLGEVPVKITFDIRGQYHYQYHTMFGIGGAGLSGQVEYLPYMGWCYAVSVYNTANLLRVAAQKRAKASITEDSNVIELKFGVDVPKRGRKTVNE